MLGPDDPLPRTPRRLLVAGASGSGKTTLARRMANRAGYPYQEIDALFHGEGWVRRPSFEADVDAFTGAPEWATEWQYPDVKARLAERADLLVWLDLPRILVLGQVVRRTVSRRLRRTELWNGNREASLGTFFTDPDHIVRWSWRTHPTYRRDVPALAAAHPGLVIVRLRSRREIERWLAGPFARAIDAPGAE